MLRAKSLDDLLWDVSLVNHNFFRLVFHKFNIKDENWIFVGSLGLANFVDLESFGLLKLR
jgi:hypothetical protein